MLSAAVAEWLGGNVAGLAWSATQIYTSAQVGVAVEHLPAEPDVAVAVLTADGRASDSAVAWDQPRLDIRIRGDRDVRTSRQLAWAIYSALHGLSNVELPGGIWLGLAVCDSSGPVASAPDDEGRWQWSVAVDCDVLAPTANRPA